jgi:hypothetical protein
VLAPLLRRLPLGSYTGIDLTPAVLPLAEAALGPVPYATHWQPGESLDHYRQRYTARIRQGWQPLSGEQQEQVITHLSQCDIPAERGSIEEGAAAAGWSWHWVWQGKHRAEALAVLTPA